MQYLITSPISTLAIFFIFVFSYFFNIFVFLMIFFVFQHKKKERKQLNLLKRPSLDFSIFLYSF
jgi:hypothetical protein